MYLMYASKTKYFSLVASSVLSTDISSTTDMGTLWLTWFDFNPSMDK